jgi:hypothetical protein
MLVDQSALHDLNDAQLAYSSRLLESVFLDEKQTIQHLLPEQIYTLYILIKVSPSTDMKTKLLSAMHTDVRFKVLALMSPLELKDTYLYCDDISFLKAHIQELDPELQQPLLKDLYLLDKPRYKNLKDASEQGSSIIHGMPLKQGPRSEELYIKDIEKVLALFSQSQTTQTQLTRVGKALDKKMPSAEPFLEGLIRRFVAQKIDLNSAQSFAIHLNFYTFLIPYIGAYPSLTQTLNDALDPFLLTLDTFPEDIWVVKILNQLPPRIIALALQRLQAYDDISEFKKRSVYSKLLKIIHKHSHSSDSRHINLALQAS